MKSVVTVLSFLMLSNVAFANSYKVTVEVSAKEIVPKVVAAIGSTGALEGSLVELGGACVFAVLKNGAKKSVQVQVLSATGELNAFFREEDQLVYEQTATSQDAKKEGYYQDTYRSKDGKAQVTIYIDKSAATAVSVKTPYTALTCGKF